MSINTTIAVDETHAYIRKTCDARKWELFMQTTPNNWGWLCVTFGMLGPAYHQVAYSYLKERAFRKVRNALKKRGYNRIGFVSGARRAESARRAKNVNYSHREGSIVWINPIADYLDCDKRCVMKDEGLQQSEVSKRLCMSGDCLCGTTFEHERERRAELRREYPAAEAKIAAGEQMARAYGLHDKWAVRPSKPPGGISEDDPNQQLPLCFSCQAAADRA